MNASIPGPLLADFSRFIALELGINLGENRSRQIEAGIDAACKEFGIKDPGSCVRWLMSKKLSKKQAGILASFITVGESYFFRQPETIDLFETVVLPALAFSREKKVKCLRSWSAACSSGEEPYTLAIILDRQKILLQDWQVDLYASDINKKFLEQARAGIYSQWKLRNTPGWARNLCFRETGKNRFEIHDHLKKMVQFDYYNLVGDDPPAFIEPGGSVDVILCCNVLMYFSPREAGRAFDNLYRYLSDDGFFIFAHTDIAALSQKKLEKLSILRPGAAIFRKTGSGAKQVAMFTEAAANRDNAAASGETGLQPDENPSPGGEAGDPANVGKEEERLTAARALYEAGQHNEVIALLHKPLVDKPGEAEEFALLARAYADSGDPDQAAAWCEKAAAAQPLNIEYRYLQADINAELGKNRDAKKSLKECLYLDPKFIPAHFSLGALCSREGETESAVKHFRNALSLLADLPREVPVPGLNGDMTVGRMIEISEEMIEQGSIAAAGESPGNSGHRENHSRGAGS